MAADTDTSPLNARNSHSLISLADFIEHPLAHELVHNGQTLQVSSLAVSHLPHGWLCTTKLHMLHIHKTLHLPALYEHAVVATFPSRGLCLVSYHDGLTDIVVLTGLSIKVRLY